MTIHGTMSPKINTTPERIRIEDPFHSSPNRSQYMSVTISDTNQLQLANCSLSNKLAITQLINNTWHYGINKVSVELPLKQGALRTKSWMLETLVGFLLVCQKNYNALS